MAADLIGASPSWHPRLYANVTKIKLMQNNRINRLLSRFCGRFHIHLPAEQGLSRGRGFVKAADARGVRRTDHQFWVFTRFGIYIDHRFSKSVEIGAADGFGR